MKYSITTLALVLFFAASFAQKSKTPHFKTISGNISCKTPYSSGDTNNLVFLLNLKDIDLEYCDSLAITFPSGFTPISSPQSIFAATTQSQDPEALNPIVGNTISWGNNDNIFGGIEPGIYEFTVRVFVAAGNTGNFTADYFLSGDKGVAGTTSPADMAGTLTLSSTNINPDIAIKLNVFNRYYSQLKTGSVQLGVRASNLGGNSTDDINVAVSVNAGTAQLLSLPNPFAANASTNLNFNTFTTSTLGTYQAKAIANYAYDKNPANNSDSLTFVVSDSVLSRTETQLGTALATGLNKANVVYGNWFDISTADTLTAVSFALKAPQAGAVVYAAVYEYTSAPGKILRKSAKFIVPSSQPNTYTLKFSKDLPLTPGKFFVAIEQEGNTSLGLALSNGAFEAAAAWIKDGEAAFAVAESFGNTFLGAFHINPIFGTVINTTSTQANIAVDVLPPAGLASITLAQATAIPVIAKATNAGATLSADANVLFKIDGTSYLSIGALPNPFATGANKTIVAEDLFTNPIVGDYQITATALVNNDEDLQDNETSASFKVSDSVYTRANSEFLLSLDFGPGTDYSGGAIAPVNALPGTLFAIKYADSISTVSVGLDKIMPGNTYTIAVFKVSNGKPDFTQQIGTSIPITSTGGEQSLTFAFTKALAVKDSIFVGLSCNSSSSIASGIKVSKGIYTSGADLIFYPSGGSTIPQLVDFNFLGIKGAFDIQLGLSKRTPLSIKLNSGFENLRLYPNPSNNWVNVEQAKGSTLSVFNTLGALVLKLTIHNTVQQINLNELPSGLYQFVFQNDLGQQQSAAIIKD